MKPFLHSQCVSVFVSAGVALCVLFTTLQPRPFGTFTLGCLFVCAGAAAYCYACCSRLRAAFRGTVVTRVAGRRGPGEGSTWAVELPVCVVRPVLVLFFNVGIDALEGTVEVFVKHVKGTQRRLLARTVSPSGYFARVPGWLPVSDRGTSYWVRSRGTGKDHRPLVLAINEALPVGAVLEISAMLQPVPQVRAGEISSRAEQAVLEEIVVRETDGSARSESLASASSYPTDTEAAPNGS